MTLSVDGGLLFNTPTWQRFIKVNEINIGLCSKFYKLIDTKYDFSSA